LSSIEDVLGFISKNVSIGNIIKKPIEESVGYVVANDIRAPKDIPSHNIALVDGYAVNTKRVGNKVKICISDLKPECAHYVKTGDHVPDIYDAVIPKELVVKLNDEIIISTTPSKYDNILRRGSDVGSGKLILSRGSYIKPQHLRMLSELGIEYVEVFSKPKVAVIPVGDEFVYGGVREYTSYILINTLRIHGYSDIVRLEPLPDDNHVIRRELGRVISEGKFNVLVTIGGSSVGIKDLTWKGIEGLSIEKYFRGLRLMPGRTTSLGILGRISIVMLPGPPPSMIAGMIYVLLPLLRRFEGSSQLRVDRFFCRARVTNDLKLSLRFRNVSKLIYSEVYSDIDQCRVKLHEPYPPRLSIISRSNSIVLLGDDVDKVKAGDAVDVRCVKGLFECEVSN